MENVINILPVLSSDKERLIQRAQKLKEKGLTHSLKKLTGSGKKRKKNGETETADIPSGQVPATNGLMSKATEVSEKDNGVGTTTGGIKNAATASLTAKVLADEKEKAKRRKVGTNDNLKSLFSSGKSTRKDGDFMTRGFSIPAGAKR